MAQYKLADQDSVRIFLVNRSTLDNRIDPIYYNSVNELYIVNNTKHPILKLGEVTTMQRGRFGHRPRNDPDYFDGQYPFIQTGNVVEANKSNGRIKYTQTLNELGLSTSRLFQPNVLVITIAANIGDTAILDYPACFPDSLIALHPKGDINIYYLNYYLKLIKSYIESLAPQSAQKNINLQQLNPIPVIVPPKQVQEHVVEIMTNAYFCKQQKESEAKALLESIDSYLLGELGIELPEQDNTVKSRIFTTNLREETGSRLDPFYHTNYFKTVIETINASIFNCRKLKEVISFLESGSRPTGGVSNIPDGVLSFGGEHVNDRCEIEILKPKYIPIEFHEKIKNTETKLLDILLVKDGATTGKIGILENPEFENQNINEHVFMIRTNEEINPYYLVYFLHSKAGQIQIQRVITGATVTGLTKDVVRNLIIPYPSQNKQNEIANHIQDIRSRAKALQQEAAQVLEAAKQEVERMMLGE